MVWKALHKYGVNPYIFFLVDLVTSWFYGVASARFVVAIIHKKISESQKWGWLSAINFMLPQIYILVSAHRVPREVYIIIFSAISVMVAFAVVGVVSQIKTGRKEKSAE